MSTLLRAPRECGSWWWEFDDAAAPVLDASLSTLAHCVDVLAEHDLLHPHRLEYGWYVPGSGGFGVSTTLALTTALSDPALPERILSTRPVGFPTAEVADIRVVGAGTWLDAQGMPHRETGLVDIEVTPDPDSFAIELTVHHDVWMFYDFSGRPHPEIQKRNAPRLAAAVHALDSRLGVQAVTGEPTYFGAADGFTIATPDPSPDGFGPDLTDKM
jgi:hypothetical protein